MKKAELRHIRKIFQTRGDSGEEIRSLAALDDVTLAFNPGEVHTILGENGAGKSTLVHILSGLHQPTSGVIAIGESEFAG
ncbi:MAG TPA: ATP-binding cassette domain-containing protein, partial [Treponemataceae bacterium]|nr:ATP-binding cassette domain-containing protein [Treponemataceae bacterium]